MRHLIIYLFIILALPLSAQWTVTTVPNPKSATSDNWVTNPDGILSEATVVLLEDKLETIAQLTGAEVTVVMLNSIGTAVPADFATQLFNTWGVGKKESNNGVLILMVQDQRRIEFRTGYGMEETLPDALCYQIQQQYIVPKFKNGDFDGGMIAGIDAVAGKIVGDDWENTPTINDKRGFEELSSRFPAKIEAKQWVIDVDSLIPNQRLLSLNQKANQIADSFGFQLRIVVLSNMPTNLTRGKISTMLREKWQVDDAKIDNHIFMVLDMNDKKNHIYYDLQPTQILSDAVLLQGLSQTTNAELIRYSYTDTAATWTVGMVLDEIVKLMTDVSHREAVKVNILSQQEPTPTYEPTNYKDYEGSGGGFWWTLFVWYLWCLGALLAFAVIFVGIAQTLPDPYKKYHILTFFALDIWMYLFPIPYIAVGILMDRLRKQYRHAPRKDAKTGQQMEMLSEEEEDKYLKAGQITEEQINSIHYDVWATQDHKELLILPYKTLFSKYGRCPKCNYRAYYLVYNHTISAATEYSSGTGEKKHSCKHCHHSRTTTYTIPRIQSSSSSSSGSSGGSSGGSFGGGSSGGGGAGSSW